MSLTPPSFLIGVWLQPVPSFAKWKARGINMLVGWKSDELTTLDTWLSAAKAAGLFYILEAPTDPATLARLEADPNCIGYLIEPDEPEGAGAAPAWVMQGKHKALRDAGAKKPAMISFESYNMIWRRMADYQLYAIACQWGGEDTYPVNQGLPLPEKQLRIRLQKALGLEVLSFIECSDQGISKTFPHGGAPTPASLKQQVATVAAEGVKGIIYFPQRDRTAPLGFAYDVMEAGVEAEMIRCNAMLLAPPVAAAVARPALSGVLALAGYEPQTVTVKPLT